MSYRTRYTSCTIWGCGGELFWRTLCRKHREQLPTVCVMGSCEKRVASRGLCAMHAFRLRKHGDPGTTLRTFTEGVIHGTMDAYKHHKCRCDECKEARRLDAAAYIAKNPGYASRAHRRARERNPERVRQYKSEWKRRNPDKVKSTDPARAAVPYTPEGVEYTRVILHDPCVYCGGRSETIDHIVPISRGGDSDWGNLAPACGSCNSSKHTKSLLDFLLYRAA